MGDPLLVNCPRIGLSQVLVGLGELDLVEPMAREALAVAVMTRDARSEHLARHFLTVCLLIRGHCANALPRYRRSLLLAIDLSGMSFWTALLDQYLGRARAELGEAAASEAWEEGRRTRFEYAIALAQDADGSPVSPDQPMRY